MGFASMLYFIAMLMGAPTIVTTIVIVAIGVLLYWWMNKNILVASSPIYPTWKSITLYTVFIAGIGLITYKASGFAEKYGGWDAWCIWNLHAKFLADTSNWKTLYSNFAWRYKHPDYPLYLSDTIALLWRLTGHQSVLVPFGLGFIFTLFIPVILYLELYSKNIFVAAILMLLLAFDRYYLNQGVQQYSDTLLALLFLSTIICLEHYKTNGSPAFITLAATMAGCCLWTKNEGCMLVLFWIVFNAKTLLANGRWKYFLAGISIPVCTLLIFKTITPTNDLIANTGSIKEFLFDASRYNLIKEYLILNLKDNFSYATIGSIIYIIICIADRKMDRNFLLLVCCVLGYLLVYLITPLPLKWQLFTSMDRVLLQIMPAFIYVIGLRLCKARWLLGHQQSQ